jgi:hypothetical protein
MVLVDAVEPRTVGQLLGLADVAGVALYSIGSEPVSRPQSTSPTRAPRTERRSLERHLHAAEAGVSDADIAREAGCTPAQVRRARLARGIRRASGRPSVHAKTTALAMSVFGTPFVPVATKVRSVVDGRFEPPRYLVREKLDFTLFARCVRALRDAGFEASTIASGIGVREADIERAEKIARRA